MSIEFDPQPVSFIPLRGTLTSFGSEADGKVVKRAGFTFRGNSGAGWTTIATDQYSIRRKTGYVEIREVDDSGDPVDWQDYLDYQDLGNTAFRATYTVKNGATETTYTNETVTMSLVDPYLGTGDGTFDGEIPRNLFVQEIHAEYGDIANWILSGTSITADSGSAVIDSATPKITLGAATDFITGTGFFVGKNSGTYKLHIGNPAGQYMSWDGSQLFVTGTIAGTITASGTDSNSWTINQDLTDTTVDLVFGRTTGGNATIRWNGSVINVLNTLQENSVTVVKENRSIGVSGTGLSGGGDLSANRTITLTSSSNPGAAASILASDASGFLTLVKLNTDTLADKSGGNLTISPAGDVIFNPTGNDILPTTNYDLNIGALSKKYLTLHAAELWVETLVAQNTIATIGGRILVLPTTQLIADLSAAATTIDVKYNNLASGDTVYMEANGSIEFMAVTSGATVITDGYRYSVTRNLDGSGANQWYAGDAIANTGNTNNSFIDIYSVRGVKSASQAGATIVGNTRNSTTYNDWSETWAIGNLNGLYGYGVDTPGAGFGKYASGFSNITVDATNGIRIRRHTTSLAQWQIDGDLLIGTDVSGASTTQFAVFNNTQTFGSLSAAQGDVFMGNASGKRVFYDASAGTLDIVGNVRISDSASANYGVEVGEAILLAHFDGARPYETDFTGNSHGHLGQVAQTAGGVIFRPGKFGKAIQVAEGTINLFADPSVEVDPITTYWSVDFGSGTGSVTRTTQCHLHGIGIFISGGSVYANLYQSITTVNDGYSISAYVYNGGLAVTSADFSFIIDGMGATPDAIVAVGGGWYYAYRSQTETAAAHLTGIGCGTGKQIWVDGLQFERKTFPTPFAYFNFAGHSGSISTTSTRTLAQLYYDVASQNQNRGTISFWWQPSYPKNTNLVGIDRVLWRWHNTSGARNDITLVHYQSNNNLGFEAWSNGSGIAASNAAGSWNGGEQLHICLTWDFESAHAMYLYVNGVLHVSQTGISGGPAANSLARMTVGDLSPGSGNVANGGYDDLAILPVVLSAAEIESIYKSNMPISASGNNSELRLTGAQLGDIFGNANGLFGRNAAGDASFGLLNGTVNATTWGGDSESFDSGDFLFGSNKSGKSNLWWDASAGALYFRVQVTKKISLDTAGTLLIGSNITAAATTGLVVFSSSITYNGEASVFAAGDVLFGDNSSGKANIFWDTSAGQLKFRTATTTKSYIDTDGTFTVVAASGTSDTPVLKWKTSGGVLAGIVSGFIDTANDFGIATLTGYGTSTGDIGIGKLQGVNNAQTKYAFAEIISDGIFNIDTTNGKNNTTSYQYLNFVGKTNVTNNKHGTLRLNHSSSGTPTTLFGNYLLLRSDNTSNVLTNQAWFAGAWSDATTGNAFASIATSNGGTLSERLIINESGKFSMGGSGITRTPTYFFEFNDANDLQANIRADASAQNDDGWVTATIDYGEYIEKADYTETIEVGDIVFIRGRKATKIDNGGTPMVVSTRSGFRTGDTMQWQSKWMPKSEYITQYGKIPRTIWEWAKKHSKEIPYIGEMRGERRIQPRFPIDKNSDGIRVLNPKWDFRQKFTPRSERAGEWVVVAFAGQVKVKVIGKVNEGDLIVPRGNGFGRAMQPLELNGTKIRPMNVVGIAWETKPNDDSGDVMIAVGV